MVFSRHMNAIAAVVLALFALGCAGRVAAQQEPAPSITVVGSATATGPPDTAEITAGVVTQATTAAQALAHNNAAMETVLKAVTSLGIAGKDVRSTGVSITPQRAQPQPGRPQAPAIIGYEVGNQVHVKVRDLAMLGRLLDTLVAQGANALGGISFSIADPTPLLMEARTRAIADARRKADVYTAAAGVKLGRVIFIRDATPGIPRPLMGRMMASAAVPVAPGEQELEVSVSVTYGLE
jgi:uncharacterized protein YggE